MPISHMILNHDHFHCIILTDLYMQLQQKVVIYYDSVQIVE